MIKPIKRKKRSKLTIALLSPVLIILFIVGWSLSSIGQLGSSKTKQLHKPIHKTPTKQEEVELIFVTNQEEQIKAN